MQRFSNSLFTKAYEWGKLISITGGAQVTVQAIGLLSGLLIIRTLSTQEYAVYTIANTLLGTLVMLANNGISVGVMFQAGKVWNDKKSLGEILVTAFTLRKKIAYLGLIIAIPLLGFLLLYNGSTWLMSLVIIAAIIPSFIAELSRDLLIIPSKLHQDVIPIQKNQIAVNLGRFMLTLSIFIFPLSFMALLATGISQLIGNISLRKISTKYVIWKSKESIDVRKKLISTIKRVIPENLYYSFSGQITIWLLTIFGTTTSLASIGALSRISMILTLIGLVSGILIIPRFARFSNSGSLLLRRYIQVQILLLILLGLIIGIVYNFSDSILWILGENYQGLNYELLLTIIGGCLNILAGVVCDLYSSRGYIMHPAYTITISILLIIIGILINDVSSLKGVLMMNIFVAGGIFLTHNIYGFYKIIKHK